MSLVHVDINCPASEGWSMQGCWCAVRKGGGVAAGTATQDAGRQRPRWGQLEIIQLVQLVFESGTCSCNTMISKIRWVSGTPTVTVLVLVRFLVESLVRISNCDQVCRVISLGKCRPCPAWHNCVRDGRSVCARDEAGCWRGLLLGDDGESGRLGAIYL